MQEMQSAGDRVQFSTRIEDYLQEPMKTKLREVIFRYGRTGLYVMSLKDGGINVFKSNKTSHGGSIHIGTISPNGDFQEKATSEPVPVEIPERPSPAPKSGAEIKFETAISGLPEPVQSTAKEIALRYGYDLAVARIGNSFQVRSRSKKDGQGHIGMIHPDGVFREKQRTFQARPRDPNKAKVEVGDSSSVAAIMPKDATTVQISLDLGKHKTDTPPAQTNGGSEQRDNVSKTRTESASAPKAKKRSVSTVILQTRFEERIAKFPEPVQAIARQLAINHGYSMYISEKKGAKYIIQAWNPKAGNRTEYLGTVIDGQLVKGVRASKPHGDRKHVATKAGFEERIAKFPEPVRAAARPLSQRYGYGLYIRSLRVHSYQVRIYDAELKRYKHLGMIAHGEFRERQKTKDPHTRLKAAPLTLREKFERRISKLPDATQVIARELASRYEERLYIDSALRGYRIRRRNPETRRFETLGMITEGKFIERGTVQKRVGRPPRQARLSSEGSGSSGNGEIKISRQRSTQESFEAKIAKFPEPVRAAARPLSQRYGYGLYISFAGGESYQVQIHDAELKRSRHLGMITHGEFREAGGPRAQRQQSSINASTVFGFRTNGSEEMDSYQAWKTLRRNGAPQEVIDRYYPLARRPEPTVFIDVYGLKSPSLTAEAAIEAFIAAAVSPIRLPEARKRFEGFARFIEDGTMTEKMLEDAKYGAYRNAMLQERRTNANAIKNEMGLEDFWVEVKDKKGETVKDEKGRVVFRQGQTGSIVSDVIRAKLNDFGDRRPTHMRLAFLTAVAADAGLMKISTGDVNSAFRTTISTPTPELTRMVLAAVKTRIMKRTDSTNAEAQAREVIRIIDGFHIPKSGWKGTVAELSEHLRGVSREAYDILDVYVKMRMPVSSLPEKPEDYIHIRPSPTRRRVRV